MSTSKALVCVGVVLTLLSVYPLLSQTRPTPGSATSSSTVPTRRGRHQPCWQQAGVSQSVMQRHRSIEQSTHSQIAAVCGDAALTAQQKAQKVRQIREQARQQQDALLSSEQVAAIKSCHEQRGGHAGPGVGGEGCGEMPTARVKSTPRSTTPEEDDNEQ